ncbi:hypothetical protein CCAE64S_03008 [Castellaniella caeni]
MIGHREDDQKLLESLRRSVAKALDRKRRLGQYAVVWKDGKSVYIGPNPPKPKEPTRSDTERH